MGISLTATFPAIENVVNSLISREPIPEPSHQNIANATTKRKIDKNEFKRFQLAMKRMQANSPTGEKSFGDNIAAAIVTGTVAAVVPVAMKATHQSERIIQHKKELAKIKEKFNEPGNVWGVDWGGAAHN